MPAALPRRGQAGQAMLVSPHHSAGTVSILAVTFAHGWPALATSARGMLRSGGGTPDSHLDSVGAAMRTVSTSEGQRENSNPPAKEYPGRRRARVGQIPRAGVGRPVGLTNSVGTFSKSRTSCPALLACFALSTFDRPGQKLPTCCQFSSRKPPCLLTSESLANVRRPGPR